MAEILSDRIDAARERHAAEYPDGDWRGANDVLGALFSEAAPILLAQGFDPWKMGNAERAKTLRGMGW